jgi:hypothetical protein
MGSGGFGETTIVACASGMSGSLKVRIVHYVNFQTGHVLASVKLDFTGISHAEIQVAGTGGLINAGGPF